MLRRWRRRWRYWRQSADRARLLRDEMEFHLEMKTRELMETGMMEPDARNAARRQFGNPTLQQEEARDTWVARWLSDFLHDAVFALRTIRRQPGFTAVATISAALGTGACSLIFGVANYALFRPLPVEDPARLAAISGMNTQRGKVGQSLSYPDVADLRQSTSFSGITAFYQFMPAAISSSGEPQRHWGSVVTANYFDVVRPRFAYGRGFDANRDDRPGEAPVAVLSYSLWTSAFAGDAGIVGRTIEVNRRKVTVVGVTEPGFQGTDVMFYSDYWLPFSMLDALAETGLGGDRLHDRGGQWLQAVGRVRPGVSLAAAASEIRVIGERLRSAYPGSNRDRGFHIEVAGQVHPGFRKLVIVFFLMLMGVAGLILITACSNVANLLLARAAARQKEIATRLAIGAGRGRLVRQLLTESVLLALAGGIGGYAIAQLGVYGIRQLRLPLALPVNLAVSLDSRVLLFCAALSALTGVIFGLAPALRATRPDLTGALKNDSGSFGRSRYLGLRNLLVIGQVTISMVLLISAGLFLRSFDSARRTDTGFTHRNLLMISFDPSLNRYAPDETRRVVDAILENTRAIPGVESVSLGNGVPLSLEGTQNGFEPEGSGTGKTSLSADIYSVAPGYFETLGIRLLAGEDFRGGVFGNDDVAIVNQALARKAFPEQSPVGRRIRYFGRSIRIIGLVATVKSRSIGEDPRACLYLPFAKDPRGNDSLTGVTLVLRTHGNPAVYIGPVRQTIRAIDPSLALFDERTMEAHLAQALLFPRLAAIVFGLAGLMGLLIAGVGLYGVISFGVARQTREIGIRMALGARRGQVLGHIMRQGLLLTAAGVAIGLAAAFAISRIAVSLLYGVSPTDPATFLAVPVFLLLIAALACLAPARRAAALDPLRALRWE